MDEELERGSPEAADDSGLAARFRALAAFAAAGIGRIVVVLHPDDMVMATEFEACPMTRVTTGAATRDASVKAGLEALAVSRRLRTRRALRDPTN